MRKFFPTSPKFQVLRYDTHEVIRTDFDIVDQKRLEILFPVNLDVFDSIKYA